MGSISHAVFFVRQYKKRYGLAKSIRVLIHYGFIVVKKLVPKSSILEVNGYKMRVMKGDPGISQELQTFRTHEPLSTKLIADLLQKGMTCLDIGANIGYYVLLESKIVGNEGKVLAIEPSPPNYECIKNNLDLENTTNVNAYNFAAGDTEGEIRFFINKRSNGCKVLLEGEKPPNRPGIITNVPIKMIDNFLEEIKIDHIDFVRMDVEGYELNIFEGMKNTIKKSKPIIQLEVHKGRMGIEKTNKFFEFFENNGYEINSYHQRDLDLPIIGTLSDIKYHNMETMKNMLEAKTLPNYFNLTLIPK